MLLISGYNSLFTRFLGITPMPGAYYWGKIPGHVNFVFKDYNIHHVNPGSGFISSPKSRFANGYEYAKAHLYELRNHIRLCGNMLHIVAHSHGVAFAEGIAAYLYERDNFITDVLVSLQGSQLAKTPQQRFAVNCRLVFKTKGDFITNRKNQNLGLTDIEVTEENLKSNFIKYNIRFPDKHFIRPLETVYIKGNIKRFEHHKAQRLRQFQIWSAINHGLKLYMKPAENALPEEILAGKKPDFLKHVFNQN